MMHPIGTFPRGWLFGYGFAVAAVALAAVLTIWIEPLRGKSSFLIFFAAVMLSLWYGRLGPGLLAIALSVLTLDFFLIPPIHSIGTNIDEAAPLCVFVLLAVLMNALHAQRLGAERTLVATADELRIAGEIQQRLFPTTASERHGFDIAGACYPANATGGDYFDYLPMSNGCVGIAIGDVSSHGFGPALLMAELHAYLHALALTHDDVGEILTLTNRIVREDTADSHFITAFLGRLDPHDRSFTYAGAGHEGYILDSNGAIETLESTSLPLGIEKNVLIPCGPSISLKPGQIVLLMTDGVIEARCSNGDLFGVARALEIVRANREKTAQEIVDTVYNAILSHSQDTPRTDDIAVIVIKVQSDESSLDQVEIGGTEHSTGVTSLRSHRYDE